MAVVRVMPRAHLLNDGGEERRRRGEGKGVEVLFINTLLA